MCVHVCCCCLLVKVSEMFQGKAAWEDWSSGKRTGLSLPQQLLFLLADAAHGYVTSTNYLLSQ